MISVIVTTKNESKHLPTFLESLKKQTYKKFEVLVVDNGSTDDTLEIAKRYKARTFTKGPERSAQRNFGVAKAKGEYVLILDADMALTPKVLSECAGLVSKDPKIEAITLPEKSFGTGFWVKYKVFEREFYLGDASIEAPRFFKTSTFKKFKGYDPGITGPEDFDLPLRMRKAGVKIGRIKSFILHDEGRFSPIKSAKKKFYYASHSRVFLKRHPETALGLGNLVLRPVFFKKWRKLVARPDLAVGMFLVKFIEGLAAFAGVIYSGIIVKYKDGKKA